MSKNNNLIGISGKISSGKDTVAQMIQYLDCIEIAESKEIKKKYSYEEYVEYNLLNITDWKIKRFADTLKDITCMLIGCTREQLEDREFKEAPLGEEWDKYIIIPASTSKALVYCDREKAKKVAQTYGLKMEKDGEVRSSLIEKIRMTPRKLMQLLGTEAGREVLHPNIWVNALFSDYNETIDMSPNPARTAGINVQSKGYPKWIIPDTRFENEAKAIRDRNGILIRINRPIKTRQKGSSEANARLHLKNVHPSETALDKWEDWDYIIENDGSLEDLLNEVTKIYNEITK